MHKLSLAAAITFFGATAHAADSERYDFDDFTSVEVSSGISVMITEGRDFEVEAEAKRGNLRRLIIEEKNGTLTISRKQRSWLFGFWNQDRFIVYIEMPDLVSGQSSSGSSMEISGSGRGNLELEASSGSSIELGLIEADALELKATSGSTIRGTELDVVTLEAHAGSGSTINLTGSCDTVEAASQSGSTISAHQLECRSGDLEASGGSTLKAHTGEAVKARASGGASISIHGNPPSADTSSSGGASLNLR